MGEVICVGFETALELWRRAGWLVACDNPASETRSPLLIRILFDEGEGIDLDSLPVRTRAVRIPRRVSARGLSTLAAAFPELALPADVCVSQQAGRHVAAGARVHLMSGSYPSGSLYRVGEGVLVTSPELTFLQLARVLDEDLLVACGYELCGCYARDGVGPNFCARPPLTSSARIGSYLDRLESLRAERGEGMPPGLARAHRALALVRDRAASPEETVVSMVLTYPRRRGGFGLPPACLNACVTLSSVTAALFGIDSFVCDMSWPGFGVVLEYQGSQHKLRARKTYDLRKGNVLGADDRTVVQLDRSMLGRQDMMEEVAKSVAHGLGVRWRAPGAQLRTRQALLRRKLLIDLEG